jgi:hypothetical protein
MQSLNLRMHLAEEIRRLSLQSQHTPNELAQQNVPLILELLSKAGAAEMVAVETIQEGLKKMSSPNVPEEEIINGQKFRNSFFASQGIFPPPEHSQKHVSKSGD